MPSTHHHHTGGVPGNGQKERAPVEVQEAPAPKAETPAPQPHTPAPHTSEPVTPGRSSPPTHGNTGGAATP
jgi:hypothetical protein